jgi:hypothetical protein
MKLHLKLSPHRIDVLSNLGLVLRRDAPNDRAIQSFGKALEI